MTNEINQYRSVAGFETGLIKNFLKNNEKDIMNIGSIQSPIGVINSKSIALYFCVDEKLEINSEN